MRKARFVIVVTASLLLSACASAQDPQLSEELRQHSANDGLALIDVSSRSIAVIPFDAATKYFNSGYGLGSKAGFGKTGHMVLWYGLVIPFRPLPDYVIETIEGQTVIRKNLQNSSFIPDELNEPSQRMIFSGQISGMPAGLYWASFDFSAHELIAAGAGSGSWSPDGHAIVYSKDGEIYIFDIHGKKSTHLIQGSDPTWCPTDETIALRGKDGRAFLVRRDGSTADWPLSTHMPLGPMRWSPDGRYVSFAEQTKAPAFSIYPQYRLVVARVADGKWVTAREFGGPGLRASFPWILNYRDFCRHCKPSQPFD